MAFRLPNILPARTRSRAPILPFARAARRDGRGRCRSCGDGIVADDHAVQLAGGLFHAGCVLYERREAPAPLFGAGERLQATR
jgi:hypothetical protein